MAMRKLILVKHSQPQVAPGTPPSQWPLSEEGKNRCGPLATKLASYEPAIVVASQEAKATQTAQIVAEQLGKPWEPAEGLHEHDRDNVPHMPTPEFLSSMAMAFQRPKDLLLGRESLQQALERFSQAIDQTLSRHPEGNVAVISHGTVIALFIAQHTKERAYPLWRRLGLPSIVIMSVPKLQVLETIDRV